HRHHDLAPRLGVKPVGELGQPLVQPAPELNAGGHRWRRLDRAQVRTCSWQILPFSRRFSTKLIASPYVVMPPLVWGLPVAWSPAAIVGSCAPLLGKLIVTSIVSSGVGSCVKLIPSDTEPFGLTNSELFAIVSKGKTPTVLDPLCVLPAASVKDASTFNF